MQIQDQPSVQVVETNGSPIIETIKKMVHEGSIRKISVKHDGRTIAEFPLTFGVVGAALAPALAAIGAIAALVTDCTIEVERTDTSAAVGTGTS